MSTGTAPVVSPGTAPKRKVPRYELTVPLNLTVLRSGVPDKIHGRTLQIGEGGMGVAVASQLLLGESVRVEFLLPHTTSPVRATAIVRYQREGCFGLQFLRLPVEQRSVIRYWTRCEGELLLPGQKLFPADAALEEAVTEPGLLPNFAYSEDSRPRFDPRRLLGSAVFLLVVAGLLGWWHWQQGWTALEAQVPAKETVVAQLKVPGDLMQRRIRHQVTPEYPEDARRAGVQGTVVLDATVNAEGAVTLVKFVSGPEALSHAAIDAVRWWRYEPYRVNGQPSAVETTVAVDFRLVN